MKENPALQHKTQNPPRAKLSRWEVRSEVGGFFQAELPSDAGSCELSSHQMAVPG